MVLVALAIRLVVMVFLLPEQLEPQRDHWHFGYETGTNRPFHRRGPRLQQSSV